MSKVLNHWLSDNPIIAAIKSPDHLEQALQSSVTIIFLLTGDLFNLTDLVSRIHGAGKKAFVHIDLIEGISSDEVALKYIAETAHPDGIITTKGKLIKAAKKLDLIAIQRLFIVDSLNIETGLHSIATNQPDAVEILPGIMPRITKHFVESTRIPVITGGLIHNKEDVIESIKAGAMGISTSVEDNWNL